MKEILMYLFSCVVSALGTILVVQFNGIRSDLKTMTKSIMDLNIKIGTLVNDMDWHKEKITGLEEDNEKLWKETSKLRERITAVENQG